MNDSSVRARSRAPGADARPGGASGRRLPVGAEARPEGGVHFRVWAPGAHAVEVALEAGPGGPGALALAREPGGAGYWSGVAPAAGAGTTYRLRVADAPGAEPKVLPDPASRFQPEGPRGPSQVIDPSAFRWTDQNWRGPASAEGQVLYEFHVGTFTKGGTWADAAEGLPYLVDLGITALELMPVAEFPGRFGWSYDGVDLFAPFHGYGTPDDFRRFVDRAHALGLSVLLDVVYNHLGPEANVLKEISPRFFSTRHATEWGEALNFDGEQCAPVREFVLANARYWVEEFHVDGMRIDATQSLFDTGPVHILTELVRTLRAAGEGGGRKVLVVGESEPQRARLLRPESAGGVGFDLLWSDDFHHAAVAAATGTREAYYGDYLGTPQELVSVTKRGWLYQGQWNLRQGKRRGSPAFDVPPHAFISYLQNHDQVANSARGDRLHVLTTPGRYRAVSALQLLGPATPLIFQGQEFAASSPFLYFGDMPPEVADEMHRGRQKFLRQFPGIATPAMQSRLAHPGDPSTFDRSKLDPAERDAGTHAEVLALYRDLLRLRREDPTLRAAQRPGAVDGAVLGPEALAVRYFDPSGQGADRLLLVNLGIELRLPVTAEPLLAPPEGRRWRLMWSSHDPRYGGSGAPEPETEELNWVLPGHSATLVAPADPGGDEARNPVGTV